MCGFVVVVADAPPGARELEEWAVHRLGHRGPDGSAALGAGRLACAHTRLAIIDPEGGQQPMRAEDPRLMLVCNGEIYNHAALRQRLALTHRFATSSDSEAVLHLYEELGGECPHLLDGMFAFVVADGQRLLAARDPFGIKPLYYGRDARGGLWLASEIKALASRVSRVETLGPGCALGASGAERRWFAPRWAAAPGSAEDASSAPRRLDDAVKKRLMSDVPLGAFLSGGFDSSAVVALAVRHQPGLETFAVGMPGAPDLEAARLVARALGTRHREYVYSEREVAAELERIIYHLESYDAALIRSAVPCFFAARLAAERVKVVLTGEGADELFAGYRYFSAYSEPRALHAECVRILLGLHSMSLQRVDRMTMAHGLEARVPFLDSAFVDFAMNLDPRLKQHSAERPEKQLLRRAFAGVVPELALERRKAEFAAGAGADAALSRHAELALSDAELARAARDFPFDTPRSKEELLYRRIFAGLFPGESSARTVSRWRGQRFVN